MDTQKLDWSKLSEMPPYAPTGPGRYLFSNGAIETIKINDFTGTWQTDSGFFVRTNGYTYFNYLRIVAPAPDVLPWEECEKTRSEVKYLAELLAKKFYPENKAWKACDTVSVMLLQISNICSGLIRFDVPHDYHLLRQQRDQYESELRAAEELNRKWPVVYDAMKAECDEARKECERLKKCIELRDKCLNTMEATMHEHLPVQSEVRLQGFVEMLDEVVRLKNEKIKQLEAERDEAQKNLEQLKRELNDAHYRIAQQSIRIQNQTRATQEAATHWHDRVLEKIKHLIPEETNQHGHPIEQLVGMVVTVLESKLQSAELLKLKWEKEYCEMTNQLKAERDEWKQAEERLRSERNARQTDNEELRTRNVNLQGHFTQRLNDLQQRVEKLEKFHEAIVKPGTGFTVVTLPQAAEPLPAVTDAVQADKEVSP